MCATISHLIRTHFAFWRDLPDYNLDNEFARLIDEMESTPSDQISLPVLRFLATLKNSHTDLYDAQLWDEQGRPFGFYARKLDEGWVVTLSRRHEIPVGSIITGVNGVDIEAFAANACTYIPSSSDRTAHSLLFARRFLFPRQFEVTLSTGEIVQCDRMDYQSGIAQSEIVKDIEGIPVIKASNFEDPEVEKSVLTAITANINARQLILDLRGNGGGNTPVSLIKALMDRPYRMWTEVTNCSISSYMASEIANNMMGCPHDVKDTPYLVIPSPRYEPEKEAFRGNLYVLIDEYCMSSTEDFLLPLSQSERATFIGSQTGGSSGQPYIQNLNETKMLRVGAKKQLFPDGSRFEGVGFLPHVSHRPTIHDYVERQDSTLELAVEIAATGA